eukprot:1120711_1
MALGDAVKTIILLWQTQEETPLVWMKNVKKKILSMAFVHVGSGVMTVYCLSVDAANWIVLNLCSLFVDHRQHIVIFEPFCGVVVAVLYQNMDYLALFDILFASLCVCWKYHVYYEKYIYIKLLFTFGAICYIW